jgi:oligopeptidase B
MAMNGGSAGGLLMGAVLNMRPDLVKVAVADVPFVDVINTMLDETLPLTVGEFIEWGNPKVKEQYEYMALYSPYENVKAQDYPHLLITTSLNDSQVLYHEPTKWCAKLRANKTDKNVLLLRCNMDAGHGGASGRYSALREVANTQAFILTQLGIKK